VLQHCFEVWAALTVSLIHAYGPELVLFSGGVMRRGEEIIAPIRDWVAMHMWGTIRGIPRIEPAALGRDAALLGAEALFERGAE
jgi:glucokinase